MIVFPDLDHRDGERRPRVLSPELEADVDYAAVSTLPVLVSAPPTAAAWLARLIYLRSGGPVGPFRVFDPARSHVPFGDHLWRMIDESRLSGAPGMLFIRDVDTAGISIQIELRDWLTRDYRTRLAPRVVASTSVWLPDLIAMGRFDRFLYDRLSAIHIKLIDPADERARAVM